MRGVDTCNPSYVPPPLVPFTHTIELPEIKTPRSKFLPFLPVFALAAFQLHIVLHEGSHAVAAKALGYDVKGFYPYPHRSQGKFYFGRIAVDPGGKEKSIFYRLAPAGMDILLFSTADALLTTKTVEHSSLAGIIVYSFGIAAPLIDFGVGYFAGSDWRHAREQAGNHKWTIDVVGGIILAVGIYRALTHTKELLK
jgi:hypothetical protein